MNKREVSFAFDKDIGGRSSQEDNILILNNENSVFAFLGDGMGGHKGGNIASETLVNVAKDFFLKHLNRFRSIEDFFRKIVLYTEKRLSSLKGDINPNTTAAFAFLYNGDRIFYANIGDSRVYIFINHKFVHRTRDHSIVEELYQRGEIREKEMATHPRQNELLRSIGPDTEGTLSIYKRLIKDDEKLDVIICSDGLWEYVSIREMEYFLRIKKDPKELVKIFIDIAKSKGRARGDNISIGLIKSYPKSVERKIDSQESYREKHLKKNYQEEVKSTKKKETKIKRKKISFELILRIIVITIFIMLLLTLGYMIYDMYLIEYFQSLNTTQ
jgi:serine/threonine protein phosphatase PrpC